MEIARERPPNGAATPQNHRRKTCLSPRRNRPGGTGRMWITRPVALPGPQIRRTRQSIGNRAALARSVRSANAWNDQLRLDNTALPSNCHGGGENRAGEDLPRATCTTHEPGPSRLKVAGLNCRDIADDWVSRSERRFHSARVAGTQPCQACGRARYTDLRTAGRAGRRLG